MLFRSVAGTTASIDVKVTGRPISLATDTFKVLGTFFVRPNYNSGNADITIKASPASGIRAGTDALVDDYNIEVTKADASQSPVTTGEGGATRIAVTTTTATLSLVPTLPTKLRIGDRIPVAVKILPTDARYIGHLKADIAIPAGDYAVVGFQSGATYTELTSAVVDAGASTFRTSTFGNTTATNVLATATFGSNKISLEIETAQVQGAIAEVATASTTPVEVGTFFLRPRKKTLTNPVVASATASVNERQVDGSFLFAAATNADGANVAAAPAISAALGTVGLDLEARAPSVASGTFTTDYTDADVAWRGASATDVDCNVDGTAESDLCVVDGRFLDVRVKYSPDLATVDVTDRNDARTLQVFSVDVVYNSDVLDLQLNGTAVAAAAWQAQASSTATSTSHVAGTGTSTATFNLTTSSALNEANTSEILRVRFKVKRDVVGSVPASLFDVRIGETTTIKNSSGLFVTDNYADPTSNGARGEYDDAPLLSRQKPATLQISTLLQGRSSADSQLFTGAIESGVLTTSSGSPTLARGRAIRLASDRSLIGYVTEAGTNAGEWIVKTDADQSPTNVASTGLMATDDPINESRFVQAIRLELRAAGAALPRRLTDADNDADAATSPASVANSIKPTEVASGGCAASSGTCSQTMQYVKWSKKVASQASAELAAGSGWGAAAEALADLEPGTYDVYIKGESSVAVIYQGLVIAPGAAKTKIGRAHV